MFLFLFISPMMSTNSINNYNVATEANVIGTFKRNKKEDAEK